MKREIKKSIALGLACALICGSVGRGQSTQANARIETFTYSNMTDKKTQNSVEKALERAGIRKHNVSLFMDDVRLYNKTVKRTGLTKKGYVTLKKKLPEYNELKLDKLWRKKYPYFDGYNCRITALTLMKNLLQVKNPVKKSPEFLIFDKNALDSAPTKHLNKKEFAKFETIFQTVPTPITKEKKVHYKNLVNTWKNCGVTFDKKVKASLITVVMHSAITDEESELYIGHAGVLVPQGKKLLFVEKLSFQSPYQVVRFHSRKELKKYLLEMYDVGKNQPTAAPFIMENNKLLL